jgi:hypothetical protein
MTGLKPHSLDQTRFLDRAADKIEQAIVFLNESDHGLIADEAAELLERIRSRSARIEREFFSHAEEPEPVSNVILLNTRVDPEENNIAQIIRELKATGVVKS